MVYHGLYSYWQWIRVITIFPNIVLYCFGMLSVFTKVFESKISCVQVAHLHNAACALLSLSWCFQLPTNLDEDFFRSLLCWDSATILINAKKLLTSAMWVSSTKWYIVSDVIFPTLHEKILAAWSWWAGRTRWRNLCWKIAKLCHIIGARGFQDLRSPSTIMATALISKHGWFTLSWQMDYLKV